MTRDFIEDLIEALRKEGQIYLILVSPDRGDNWEYHHNINNLPGKVAYPDGCIRTREEDMADLVSKLDYYDDGNRNDDVSPCKPKS